MSAPKPRKRLQRIASTNDQRKILEFTGTSLVLDRGKTFIEEFLCAMGSFLIHGDLGRDVTESTRLILLGCTYNIHRLGDQPTRHSDIDSRFLSVTCQYPNLSGDL